MLADQLVWQLREHQVSASAAVLLAAARVAAAAALVAQSVESLIMQENKSDTIANNMECYQCMNTQSVNLGQ